MNQKIIKLSTEKANEFEYDLFEYQALENAINQFMSSDFDYNEEHFNLLIKKYTKAFKEIRIKIFSILEKANIKVNTMNFGYYYNDKKLTINY